MSVWNRLRPAPAQQGCSCGCRLPTRGSFSNGFGDRNGYGAMELSTSTHSFRPVRQRPSTVFAGTRSSGFVCRFPAT